jgi:uncharacterized membrane protein YidH (DUF202 family)
MTAPALFDPGLQPERTELAWRRTALSLGTGSVIAARLLPELFGDALWAVPGAVGVVLAVLLWGLARRRYLAFGHQLRQEVVGRLPGAGLLAVTAVGTTVIGLTGAGVLVVVVLGSP